MGMNTICSRGEVEPKNKLSYVLGMLIALLGIWHGFPLQAQEGNELWEEAAAESFWYSLYNLESLVLTSGLGLQYPANARESPDPTLTDPQLEGFALLQAPFRSGNPHYAQTPDLDHPATLHWDSIGMERIISLEALAYTVIAEVEWAKRLEQFARAQSDSSRFAQREAQILFHLAEATMDFAERKLKRPDGLYRDELRWWREAPLAEGPPPWRGQLAWLWALSVLMSTNESSADVSVYASTREETERFFRTLDEQLTWQGLSIHDASLAIKALTWFSALSGDRLLQRAALDRVSKLSDLLLQSTEQLSSDGRATVVSGLLYAYHLTRDERFRTGALATWKELLKSWDEQIGLFVLDAQAPLELTLDGVGEVLSAFHTMIYATQDEATKLLYAKFFQTLKVAGLQRAEGAEAGGGFDGDPVPDLRQAGEAPVLVGAVHYSPELGWHVSDDRFYTASALYAANTWLWLSVFQAEAFQGPPLAGLPESEAVQEIYLPHRIEALSESLAQTQGELERLGREMTALRQQVSEPGKLKGIFDERANQLEGQVNDLRRTMEQKLQELNAKLTGQADQNMLDARFQELRTQLDQQLTTKLNPLIQSLDRFDQQLARLNDFSTNFDAVRGEIRGLTQRVSALEEGLPQPWLVRPEILLLAVLLVGIALTTVGVLRLRRKA